MHTSCNIWPADLSNSSRELHSGIISLEVLEGWKMWASCSSVASTQNLGVVASIPSARAVADCERIVFNTILSEKTGTLIYLC